MRALGILANGIRFRQHMHNEMAHYASDCWDCELLTSYGWIECVGLADRSCYDLQCHSRDSKTDLVAYETFKEPIVQHTWELHLVDKAKFKSYVKGAVDALTVKLNDQTSETEKQALQAELEKDGKITVTLKENQQFVLTKEMIQFKIVTKKIAGRHYTPAVIEPSFGIGMYNIACTIFIFK